MRQLHAVETYVENNSKIGGLACMDSHEIKNVCVKAIGRCAMVDNEENSEREKSRGAKIQILGTNPDNPEKGRIFVCEGQY